MMQITYRYHITKLFQALRRKGFVAAMNFMCCRSCAQAELDATMRQGRPYTFCTKRENDKFQKPALGWRQWYSAELTAELEHNGVDDILGVIGTVDHGKVLCQPLWLPFGQAGEEPKIETGAEIVETALEIDLPASLVFWAGQPDLCVRIGPERSFHPAIPATP